MKHANVLNTKYFYDLSLSISNVLKIGTL